MFASATRIPLATTFIVVTAVCAGPPLDQVSFLAEHNSFQSHVSPFDQIVLYNVWEVEIDFGQADLRLGVPDEWAGQLVVGHEGPGMGMNNPVPGPYLVDWLQNIAGAAPVVDHPILIKLEAATSCPDHWTPCGFRWNWPNVTEWSADWKNQFRDALCRGLGCETRCVNSSNAGVPCVTNGDCPQGWCDADNIFSPNDLEEFRARNHGQSWPRVEDLAGQVIVSLQPRRPVDLEHIDGISPLVFVGVADEIFPGLSVGRFGDQTTFFNLLQERKNRLISDSGWFWHRWVHFGVHPAVPLSIAPPPQVSGIPLFEVDEDDPPTGTPLHPFHSVGLGIHTTRVVPIFPTNPQQAAPRPSFGKLALDAGVYPEKLTITHPVTLTSPNAVIGGEFVAYTLHVQIDGIQDDNFPGLPGRLTATVVGDHGTIDCEFIQLSHNDMKRCTRVLDIDIGDIESLNIQYIYGFEAVHINCAFVDSATRGRFYASVNDWVSMLDSVSAAAIWVP